MIKLANNLTKLATSKSQLQFQQYMPQNERRELSEKEMNEIIDAQSRILPKFFVSHGDPIHHKIYNPLTKGVLNGLLGALAGGLGGAAIGTAASDRSDAESKNRLIGALIGGGLTGGITGILGYLNRDRENRDLIEAMTRLPQNATVRDYEADPLYQKELDRKLQKYQLNAMLS